MILDIGDLTAVDLMVKARKGTELYIVTISAENLTTFTKVKSTEDFNEALDCYIYYKDKMLLERSKQ